MSKIRLDKEEADLLDSYEAGEWRTIEGWETEAKRYQEYAHRTFEKDKQVNVRLSSGDLAEIQKNALEQGIPYETLIESIIHKYVSGWLVEDCEKA
jgi:predicted DNA binding CopG/RHH family protein